MKHETWNRTVDDVVALDSDSAAVAREEISVSGIWENLLSRRKKSSNESKSIFCWEIFSAAAAAVLIVSLWLHIESLCPAFVFPIFNHNILIFSTRLIFVILVSSPSLHSSRPHIYTQRTEIWISIREPTAQPSTTDDISTRLAALEIAPARTLKWAVEKTEENGKERRATEREGKSNENKIKQPDDDNHARWYIKFIFATVDRSFRGSFIRLTRVYIATEWINLVWIHKICWNLSTSSTKTSCRERTEESIIAMHE